MIALRVVCCHCDFLSFVSQVVQFLIQQTRSNEDFRLVDSRNFAGETPLLRCMSTGNIPVAKVLIEEGSDCLATDNNGGSIFTRLARAGHLWCLNFMFNSIWYVSCPPFSSRRLTRSRSLLSTAICTDRK